MDRADQYRARGDDYIDEAFLNKRFLDINARLRSLEAGLAELDSVRDQLVERGLQQVTQNIATSIAAINAQITAASASVAAAANAAAATVAAAAEAVEGTLDEYETLVETLQGKVSAVQTQISDILESAEFTASSINLTAIAGVAATNVQAAIAEHQADINALDGRLDTVEASIGTLPAAVAQLQSDFEDLENYVDNFGDTKVVANMTEAAALTGLSAGDVVHVENGGESTWVRYQIIDSGDGSWSDAEKILYGAEGSAPATHSHAMDDVSGLSAALAGKAPTSRSIGVAGLAQGGGDLTANRTITVPKAVAADVRAGTDDTKALTTKAVHDAVDWVPLTDAAPIAVDMATGTNFYVTVTASRQIANPTNKINGKSIVIEVTQDATGGHAITFASDWKHGEDEAEWNTAPNAVNMICGIVRRDGTIWYTVTKGIGA